MEKREIRGIGKKEKDSKFIDSIGVPLTIPSLK